MFGEKEMDHARARQWLMISHPFVLFLGTLIRRKIDPLVTSCWSNAMSMRYGLKVFGLPPQSRPAGLDWDFVMMTLLGACGGGPLSSSPPPTRTDNVKEVLPRRGDYRPLPMAGGSAEPETRAWIAEQNRHTQSVFEALPGRGPIEQRLTELKKIDTNGMPVERNGRYFFSRRKADQDQFVIYMRKGLEGPDTVLVDPHPMSPERTTSVDMMDISEGGSLLAYGVRQGGEDEVSVRLLNVDTGEHLGEELPKARYFGISLKPDKSGFLL